MRSASAMKVALGRRGVRAPRRHLLTRRHLRPRIHRHDRIRVFPDHFDLPGDLPVVEILQAFARARQTGDRMGAYRRAVGVANLGAIAGRDKMRHIQCQKSGPLGTQQRPQRIGILVPLRKPGHEVRLCRPHRAVVHGAMILQALQQHVIEPGRPDDLAHRHAGKAVEQKRRTFAAGLPLQKIRIIGKARDKAIDVAGEFGVAAAAMRQVGIGLAGLLGFRRPHGVGVDRGPLDDGAGAPIGRHPAHDKDVIVDRSAIGRQQADRHHRIGDDVHGGVESFAFGIGSFVLLGRWLQDRFQINRNRVIAACDHVFLVQIGRGEDVEQRQPCAGAPEEQAKARIIRACRVVDEFAPAIPVPRDRADGLQRDRRGGAVQSLDQSVPGNIEP